MTYEEILERMKARIPKTIDSREGSVIHDALSPAAYELAAAYAEMEEKRKNTFAGTADREGLIARCAEIGIVPNPSTYAIRTGLFTPITLDIEIGERFNLGDVNFVVTEKVAPGEYYLQCEEKGTVGNRGAGNMIPIDYVPGLETAVMTSDIVIYGEDEEDTEELRQRYFDTLPTFTIDGNIVQYEKWCRSFSGIGKYRIFPLWNGKNTVKVSILSSENTAASQTLIDSFQEYLDPPKTTIDDSDTTAEDYPQGRGLGNGIAPIGAIVTVSTAEEVLINVSAQVMLKTGYEAIAGLEEELNSYFKSVNYNRNYISYVAIASIIQNNDSVDTVFSVKINNGTSDIELESEQIAKSGTITVEVI